MGQRVRIGIVGAGSIGCYVGGKVVAADSADVTFVGRPRLQEEIARHGLTVRDLGNSGRQVAAERVNFVTDLAATRDCDIVLCCVKSAQTAEIARQLASTLSGETIVASLQNGVRNPDVLRAELGSARVIPAIVSFNVVSRGDGVFHRGTDGPLLFEENRAPRAQAMVRVLKEAGLEVEERQDLAPDQWTKLLVNLNNAVSALSDAPTTQLLLSRDYRRIIAALIEEALRVLRAAHIATAPLRGVPVGVMPFILRLPTPLTRIVLRAQMRIDPESRSSMWEDLTRRRPTEVDYLNGEIVRLGNTIGVDAPLNRSIAALIHEAEERAAGSPALDAQRLASALGERTLQR